MFHHISLSITPLVENFLHNFVKLFEVCHRLGVEQVEKRQQLVVRCQEIVHDEIGIFTAILTAFLCSSHHCPCNHDIIIIIWNFLSFYKVWEKEVQTWVSSKSIIHFKCLIFKKHKNLPIFDAVFFQNAGVFQHIQRLVKSRLDYLFNYTSLVITFSAFPLL